MGWDGVVVTFVEFYGDSEVLWIPVLNIHRVVFFHKHFFSPPKLSQNNLLKILLQLNQFFLPDTINNPTQSLSSVSLVLIEELSSLKTSICQEHELI